MSFFSKSGAGHTIQGKYRVYGEGSVHHGGNPCEHGLDLDRHPLISRSDWPSFWHYQRGELANAWSHHEMRQWGSGETQDNLMKKPWPNGPLNRLMRRLLGPPYLQVPTIRAGIRPADSIYDRSDMIEEMETTE